MSKYVLGGVLALVVGGAAWQALEAPAKTGGGPPVAPAAAVAPAPWHTLSGTVSSVDVARGRLWLLPASTSAQPPQAKDMVQLSIDRATRLVRQNRALAWLRLHAGERVRVSYRPVDARHFYVRRIEVLR